MGVADLSAGGGDHFAKETAVSTYCRVLCRSVSNLTPSTNRSSSQSANSLACLGNCICSVVLGTNLAVLSEALVGPSDPYNLLFFWITQSTTSLLFLIRIWAVYRYSKYVRYAFCALWTAVAASPALILIGRAPNDTCKSAHLRPPLSTDD